MAPVQRETGTVSIITDPEAALVARFLHVADERPDATAVIDGATAVTYEELRAEAVRIAVQLAGADATLVGLRMRRSWRAIAAMIGIGLSGRAYVPIDPTYPQARQEYVAADARLQIFVEDCASGWRLTSRAPVSEPHDVPDDCVYVIYTSGSAGSPKGVVVGHANVTALLTSCAQVVGRRPGRRWSVFHSFSFDFSVWEIWGPLLEGSTAVLVDRDQYVDPAMLSQFLADARIEVLSLVPSAFTYLVKSLVRHGRELPHLEYVIFGGEAIRTEDIKEWWLSAAAPSASLVNMYGITETTVHVTQCQLTPDVLRGCEGGRTPIGQPLAHLRVRLTDDSGRHDVAPGQPGQLVISGGGVAHGYLGRAELNAVRFPVIDGKRCYLSGDWAVRDADGTLYYLGRRDDQVKIHGHRVELGEVDAVVAAHPQVIEAACTLQKRPGVPDRIIACVVADQFQDARELRRWLSGRVPAHLVPARVVFVDRLPKAASGKLARDDLAALIAGM